MLALRPATAPSAHTTTHMLTHNRSHRPRVLGLTASPEGMLALRRRGRPPLPGLQHNLDCEVATVPEGPLRCARLCLFVCVWLFVKALRVKAISHNRKLYLPLHPPAEPPPWCHPQAGA